SHPSEMDLMAGWRRRTRQKPAVGSECQGDDAVRKGALPQQSAAGCVEQTEGAAMVIVLVSNGQPATVHGCSDSRDPVNILGVFPQVRVDKTVQEVPFKAAQVLLSRPGLPRLEKIPDAADVAGATTLPGALSQAHACRIVPPPGQVPLLL